MNTKNDAITNDAVMNQKTDLMTEVNRTIEEERLHRKQRLTAGFRLFGKFGFDEGVAGHITVRDPEKTDHFWVNPMGVSFKQMKMSDLILVSHEGEVVEGDGLLNGAAFTIHSNVHSARPDVVAAAHSHSLYGKTWATQGRLLDPITQDSCAFYEDHALYEEFGGVALAMDEGERIAKALGDKKAAILQNHGLITVGETVEAAVWWYVTMERSCQAQIMAESLGTKPKLISHDVAQETCKNIGNPLAGQFQFTPMYNVITEEQPDMFD